MSETHEPGTATSFGFRSVDESERQGLVNRVFATVADIAGRLFLSEGTVRNYLSSAIGKTGARTRVEAARVAAEKGWL